MMKKLLPALAAVLLAQAGAQAQNWQEVNKLYKSGMYSEAVQLLGNSTDQKADAYRALCALGMRSEGAYALCDAFLGRNPDHVMAPQVRFQMALGLFDDGAYAKALEQLEQCRGLYPSQLQEYHYKRGYSAYSLGDWDYARVWLGKVEGRTFRAPAQFTLGYMDYAQKDFSLAEKHLKEAAGDHRFASLAQYYLLECRFNAKDYAYVVKHGTALYENAPEDRKAGV